MTRTLKLALVVSLVIHAAAFAVFFAVSGNERKLSGESDTHIVLLVPVQEDFVAHPADAPSVQEQRASVPQSKVDPVKPTAQPEVPKRAEVMKTEQAAPVAAATPPRRVEPIAPVVDTSKPEAQVDAQRSSPAAISPVKQPEPSPVTNAAVLQAPVTITGRVKYRKAPEPEYPALARRRRQEGTVLLNVLIGTNGRALEVSVNQSSSIQLLDRAAVEAVKHWEFDVQTDVLLRAEVPVRFHLTK